MFTYNLASYIQCKVFILLIFTFACPTITIDGTSYGLTNLAQARIIIKDVPLEQTKAWQEQTQRLYVSKQAPEATRVYRIIRRQDLPPQLQKPKTQHASKYYTQKPTQALNIPTPWQDIIYDASRSNNVPAALIAAIIKTESNFNPRAVSSKGARGAMQIMPGTGKYLGLHNFFDPRANVHAGAKYFAELLKEFTTLQLALAAYNAGPQRVRDYKGIPPFKETQTYVKRVLTYYNEFNTTPLTIKSH